MKDNKKEGSNTKQNASNNNKTKEKQQPAEPEPEPEPTPEVLLLNKFQALLLKAKKDQEEVDKMLNCGSNSTSAAVDKFENSGKTDAAANSGKRILGGSEEVNL